MSALLVFRHSSRCILLHKCAAYESASAQRFSAVIPPHALQVAREGHCLRIEVLRAESLPKMDTFGTCDAYVILTVQSEAGLQMFSTRTISDTLVCSQPA